MSNMLETFETPVHSEQKKVVLKAIEDAGGKITVADMSTRTGLPVLAASSLLNQIAYETGGHLNIGTAGSVAYEFQPGFQNEYLTRSGKNFFLRMWRIVVNSTLYAVRLFSLVMFFLIRVSFGIALILSVVLIVVLVIIAVVAIFAKMMGDDNDSAPDFDLSGLMYGTGHFFRYWIFDWMWDWWYWGQYLGSGRSPVPVSYDQGSEGSSQSKEKKESFLDKVFSFLFGDGDPNPNFEEKYWRTLSLYLKAKHGIVTAEELAPYANVEGNNEDWVLPILVRFNGNCEVTDSGNIIYKFPSFQQSLDSQSDFAPTVNFPPPVPKSNAAKKVEELHNLVEKSLQRQKSAQSAEQAAAQIDTIYLRENPWEFSHVTGSSRTAIIAFAIFIFVGSLVLITLAATVPLLILLMPILLAMAAYGALFLIVPTIRHFVIEHINGGIARRNSKRQAAAGFVRNPDQRLATKLSEADELRRSVISEAGAETIVYSTKEDALDQEFRTSEDLSSD